MSDLVCTNKANRH